MPIPISTRKTVIHVKTPTAPMDRGAEITRTVPMIVTTSPRAQTRRRPNMSPKSPNPTCPTMHPRLAAALRTPPCSAICGTEPLLCRKSRIFKIGTMRLMVKLCEGVSQFLQSLEDVLLDAQVVLAMRADFRRKRLISIGQARERKVALTASMAKPVEATRRSLASCHRGQYR